MVTCTREALGVVTAKISDVQGQSVDIGRQTFREAVAGDPNANISAAEADEEDWQKAVSLNLGLTNLCLKLVHDMAAGARVTEEQILAHLGNWLDGLEAGDEGEQTGGG
jgi:hypothetical protein